MRLSLILLTLPLLPLLASAETLIGHVDKVRDGEPSSYLAYPSVCKALRLLSWGKNGDVRPKRRRSVLSLANALSAN